MSAAGGWCGAMGAVLFCLLAGCCGRAAAFLLLRCLVCLVLFYFSAVFSCCSGLFLCCFGCAFFSSVLRIWDKRLRLLCCAFVAGFFLVLLALRLLLAF